MMNNQMCGGLAEMSKKFARALGDSISDIQEFHDLYDPNGIIKATWLDLPDIDEFWGTS